MSSLILKNVSVEFDIHDTENRRNSYWSRYFISNEQRSLEVLQNVNLEFTKGDRIALIGSNGAGKSTLMKVMTGILPPTTGEVSAHGEVLGLLKGSLAFMKTATVKQNIKLEGLKLGLHGAQLDDYINNVVAMIEMDEFLHTPVLALSDGMKKRVQLALSSLRPESPSILIMDEWIGVLDKRIFNPQQSLTRLIETSDVFVVASHNKKLLKTLCNEAIYIEKGKVTQKLKLDEAIDKYM